MAAFIYTRAYLLSRINAGIQGKIGMIISKEDLANEVVREVNNRLDLVPTRRKASLVPGLFDNDYDYQCPVDLNTYSIIDIPQQAKRSDGEFFFIPSQQFNVRKPLGAIAIDDFNGTRVLKIASRVNSKKIVLSPLSGLTSNGTWALFGDAVTLAADTDDFILGSGSIKFNISAAGGVTAGIQTSNLNAFDITAYLGGFSSIFTNAKINSIVGLTNYILRIGSDSSNYYQITVTARNDGTAFIAGWNPLRFDLKNMTTVGTPVNTSMKYAALYMTKLGSKISESDYKFNYLQIATGSPADVEYYSKYGWIDGVTGAYKQDSTDDSDLIVADNNEVNLFIKMGRKMAADEIDIAAPGRNPMLKVQELLKDYTDAENMYKMEYPSESKVMTSEYYDYSNRDDFGSSQGTIRSS